MTRRIRTYSAILAVVLICPLLTPLTALAGTTGALSGVVTDQQGRQPVPDAKVTATSPSQVQTVASDASGRYEFISLDPDTYVINVSKSGYQPVSISGIAVFADQTQVVPVAMQKSLSQIAHTTSRSSMDPVRAGTTTDVYSVNSAAAAAAAPLGGGGALNSVYSAIASMPGAYVPPGQEGVNQIIYIRGGNYDQIGFEYDGIPINRSFDNYPSGAESTLGQQELEIYTGGGGADANATGLSGFINQVIKTGTYPGYAVAGLAAGSPTFYHDARIETGGSTPDRSFSYYVGLSGTDQDFRYFNQGNGAGLGSDFPYARPVADVTTYLPFLPAVYPSCNTSDGSYTNPAVSGADGVTLTNDPGCFGFYPASYGNIASVDDREAVANFHFQIPHRFGSGHDDLQLLLMSSANFTQFYSSLDDAGPLGQALVNEGYTNDWPDAYTYPIGTPFLASAATPAIAYLFPGSPTDRCANVTGVPNACPVDSSGNQEQAQVPDDYRDGRWDLANIEKLQYQKNLSDTAYVRAFGYMFYSNTNRSSANGYGNNYSLGVTNYDYEVDAHTSGAQMQFGDQLSSEHLLSGMLNYVTSTTLRYYNDNYENSDSQQVSNFTNGSQCFDDTTGAVAPCNSSASQGTFGSPFGPTFDTADPCANGEAPPSSPACQANAKMLLTYLGNQAEVNSITPKFLNAAITDEWRPNDNFYLTASMRFSTDQFDLADTDTPAMNFWFSAAQNEFCVNPLTRQPIFIPQPPQTIAYFQPYVGFNCPVDSSTGTAVQTVHPNGTDGILLTNNYPSVYTQSYVEPRVSMTYTSNPQTVLRFSAGRYAQEPQNYEIQYDSAQPNLASQLLGFIPFGFSSPLHEAQAQFSDNYDFSYEHRFKGTDTSIKVTPYYRWATQQLYETLDLPSLGVSPSFNSGTQRTDGVELEVTKGDFSKDGFSGILSYTYTNAAEKWGNFPDTDLNPIDQYNQDIEEFNALTSSNPAASPCYANSADATADPTCGPSSIRNPYYSMKPQPLLNRNGWYAPGLDYPYLSPNTFSLILNYRRKTFAITPAMSLSEGTTYGNPADVQGLDPRLCSANQASIGVTTGNPMNADYTSCSGAFTSDGTTPGTLYIPNPQTGTFDTFGEFRQPWQFNLGLQMSYDFSPRITGKVVIANLLNRCFGGSSEPWTKAYPASSVICAYGANPFYVGGGFYNGASPNDTTANGVPLNPYFANSFTPSYADVNALNYPMPLNIYFSIQVKV